MGARSARDEEPAGVSEGVAVRPSCRTDGCWDDACCSSPAGPVAALTAGDADGEMLAEYGAMDAMDPLPQETVGRELDMEAAAEIDEHQL